MLLQPSAAQALRCDGKIVAPPMPAVELESLCGEPALRDDWVNHAGYTVQEQWYYNFGPRRLLYILTLRRGRLVNMETDGHGFTETDLNLPGCRPNDIIAGMNKLNVLHICGEPEQKNVMTGYQSHPPGRIHFHKGHAMLLKREEWFYNFGPRHLRREIVLINGRVSHIRTHGYGD